jgi:uncharacterized repeat protein (TIGR01451 family)
MENMLKKCILIMLALICALTIAGAASAASDVQIDKKFTDSSWQDTNTANLGDFVYGIVSVTNMGPDPATGVVVSDPVPAGLTYTNYYASYDNGSTWNYLDGNFNPTTGDWNVGNMNVGTTAHLAVLYQLTGTGPITNTATIGTNQATATLNQKSGFVDLTIIKDLYNYDPFWNYGSSYSYWIYLWNNLPTTANQVTVTDSLPAGLVFENAIVSTGTFDPNTMTWYIGDLNPGDVPTLQLFVTVTGSNTILTNTVTVTSNNFETDPSDNTATVDVIVLPASYVGLSKEFQDLNGNVITQANYQDNFWALIKAINQGPDSSGVIIEDVLNTFPFIQFATDTFGESFYVSYNQGVTWTPGSTSGITMQDLTAFANFHVTNMPVYQELWLKVYMTSDFSTGTFSNDVQAFPTFDYLPPSFATANITILPAADLTIIKDCLATPDPYSPYYTANYGDNVDYFIYVGNNGPDTAQNVVVTDGLPAGLVITSVNSVDKGTFNPVTGVWTIGDFTPYEGLLMLWFTAQVKATGQLDNTATASTTTTELNPLDNTATVYLNVPNANTADIGVTKTFLDGYWSPTGTANVGDFVYGLVNVTNLGPDQATGVVVNDAIPAGLSYVGRYYTSYNNGVTWSYNDGSYDSNTGNWATGTVNNGDHSYLAILYQVTGAGIINNTATKTAEDQYDPNPANNTSTASISVPV